LFISIGIVCFNTFVIGWIAIDEFLVLVFDFKLLVELKVLECGLIAGFLFSFLTVGNILTDLITGVCLVTGLETNFEGELFYWSLSSYRDRN